MKSYIYEHKHVSSTKKIKWCNSCCKEIPIGSSNITVVYYDGYNFDNDDICSEECLEQYTKDFNSEEE